MVTRKFIDFLNDERGSYTIWSLVWFIMYVLIGGLAVDGTDAYRIKTELQATADAAALAGVMSVGAAGQDPVQVAVDYAEANMSPALNGEVLKPDDVHVGTFDFDARTFSVGGTDPNAVYVATKRSADNLNAVAMSFLRIAQIWGFGTWWNIATEAIAVIGIDACHNGGIIAGGKLEVTASATFKNNICLHGEQGFKHTRHNTYEDGVFVSVGCGEGGPGEKCLLPNTKLALDDPDFREAFGMGEDGQPGNYDISMPPVNATNVDYYIAAVEALGAYANGAEDPDGTINYTPDFDAFMNEYELSGGVPQGLTYDGLDYLTVDGDGTTVVPMVEITGNTIPSDSSTSGVFKNKIYKVDCGTSSNMTLPEGEYRNIAIIATCPINTTSGNFNIRDTMIVVDGNYANDGLHFAGQVDVGDTGDCKVGGLELITTGSGVHFASSNVVNNVRILANGDVHAAAGTDGTSGLSIEATGDVSLTQGGGFGLCPDSKKNGSQKLAYALVH